jgi:cell division protein FtsW (lipid II flippase)
LGKYENCLGLAIALGAGPFGNAGAGARFRPRAPIARDAFGALLAGGVTAWFGVQAIVNIGGVTGAMPVTGLTLPFISYGGSSLLVTMAATGLLLNVARHMK